MFDKIKDEAKEFFNIKEITRYEFQIKYNYFKITFEELEQGIAVTIEKGKEKYKFNFSCRYIHYREPKNVIKFLIYRSFQFYYTKKSKLIERKCYTKN